MNKVFIGIGLTLALNLAAAAQNQKRSPEAGDTENNGKAPQSQNSSRGKKTKAPQKSGDPVLSSVTSVQAQLQSTLDVRDAKVGDEVLLKTTQAIKQNGETVVPKGTNLVGRITEVSQRAKNGSASRLGMIFDRLDGRDLSAPIRASIVSITNVRAAASSADLFDSDITGTSQSSGSVRRENSGGGLLGGVGSTVGGVGSTVGGVVNTATSTVGAVTDAATQTVGSGVTTLGNTVNGIQISNSLSGSASGGTTLSAAGKNLRLEKGVVFQMSVASQE